VETGRSVLRIVHNGRLVHDHARLSLLERGTGVLSSWPYAACAIC
jgi:hypothetical protein